MFMKFELIILLYALVIIIACIIPIIRTINIKKKLKD